MAFWWTITRSMVGHCLALGSMLIYTGFAKETSSIISYQLVLRWAPIELWGLVIIGLGIAWLYTQHLVCLIVGILISLWFLVFAVAFFLTWITIDVSGTIATGWITYMFMAWLWGTVGYVVWRDESHVAKSLATLNSINQEIDKLKHEGESHGADAE